MTIMTRKEEWAQAFGDIGIAPRMQLMQLPLHILDPWQGANGQPQPFKPYTPEKLEELAESIRQNGIIEAISVRTKPDGRMEILAGHNRVAAAKLAGLQTVPAIVQQLDDDAAEILLVDSNLKHRGKLLPSEKARAYKMLLEARKRQGQRTDLTSVQIEQKFRLSKKSSPCWAFSIIYAIIIMGDEKCWNAEKWNEEYTKSWTPRAWCLRSICCAKLMQQSTGTSSTI